MIPEWARVYFIICRSDDCDESRCAEEVGELEFLLVLPFFFLWLVGGAHCGVFACWVKFRRCGFEVSC